MPSLRPLAAIASPVASPAATSAVVPKRTLLMSEDPRFCTDAGRWAQLSPKTLLRQWRAYPRAAKAPMTFVTRETPNRTAAFGGIRERRRSVLSMAGKAQWDRHVLGSPPPPP